MELNYLFGILWITPGFRLSAKVIYIHGNILYEDGASENEDPAATKTICVRFKKNFTLTGKLSKSHAFEISTGNLIQNGENALEIQSEFLILRLLI